MDSDTVNEILARGDGTVATTDNGTREAQFGKTLIAYHPATASEPEYAAISKEGGEKFHVYQSSQTQEAISDIRNALNGVKADASVVTALAAKYVKPSQLPNF